MKQKHKEEEGLETGFIYKIYKKIEQPLLDSSGKRWVLLGITVVLLIGFYADVFYKISCSKNVTF